MMVIQKSTLSCVVATLITLTYAFASFYPDDAEVFLFPRIIAVLMAILCVFLWVNTFTSDGSHGSDDPSTLARVLPGMAIGLIYLLVMETVGFYTASFFAFIAIVIIYSGEEKYDLKSILKKVVIALLFMTVLYFLFWKGLHVRTPQGFLF